MENASTGGDICIGDHVWIGYGSKILKNSVVSNDSIIGTCSLINKKFYQSNIIIAGIPGRIVKEHVNWDRRAPIYYQN